MFRPVHFEIHASNPERARQFYTAVFGWRFEQFDSRPYWLIRTGEGAGIDGGLVPREGPAPSGDTPVAAFTATMEVDDLDRMLAAVESAGGRVETPKMPIPGMGWLGYCRDTEGNVFGMFQGDENAR